MNHANTVPSPSTTPDASAQPRHSQLIAPCCTRCTHTPSSPCRDVIRCLAEGPVCHSDNECAALRRNRLAVAKRGGEGTLIFIGAGTCGRANGATKVIASTKSFLAEHGVNAKVLEVGCVGFCQREVFVDVAHRSRRQTLVLRHYPRQCGRATRRGVRATTNTRTVSCSGATATKRQPNLRRCASRKRYALLQPPEEGGARELRHHRSGLARCGACARRFPRRRRALVDA